MVESEEKKERETERNGGGAPCAHFIFTQEDGERDRKRKNGFCRGASHLLSPRTLNVHWEAAEAGRLQGAWQPPGGGWREPLSVEGAQHCWFHTNLTPQPQLADVKTGNK